MTRSNEPAGATPYDLRGKRVWVAGHRGMVGAALVRRLARENCTVLTATRTELDLLRPDAVHAWMAQHKPQAVFVAAARVGGILANDTLPASFLYENLMIETSIIHAAHQTGVEKLLFLGSSCIYPRLAPQPIAEEALLTGPLEPTNEWYAIAKIAGIKLAQAYRHQYGCDYISAMPTNLYGPGDNYELTSSHVIPALIRKAHEAKTAGAHSMEVWGTGTPRREFMHVEDCADALVHVMAVYSAREHINIGAGSDVSILEVAQAVCDVVGFKGAITHDLTKPDGTPQKLMSSARLETLGWQAKISLSDGLAATYAAFLRSDAATCGG
jgi:GDP-L-fucose synthase